MDEFNEKNNNYEENGDEMNEEMEIKGNEYEENEEIEEDEGQLERDRFEVTITQSIGEDIIQIENYPEYHIEEDNFCDYDLAQNEMA